MSEKNTAKGPMGGGGPGAPVILGAKPKDFKGTLKRLLGFMKPYKMGVILVVISSVLATIFTTLGPRVLGFATSEIARGSIAVLNGSGGGIDFTLITKILIGLGTIYLLSACFKYIEQFTMAGVSQKTMYDLRKAVDEKIATLPLNYYDSNPHGDILSRVTNDVDTVSTSLQQTFTQIITSVLSVVFILIMMLSISPLLTFIGLITIPFALLISMTIVKKSQGFYRGQQRSLGDINGHVEEMLTGHNVIKVFGREEEVIDTFDEINGQLYKNAWKAQFVSSIIMPTIGFLSNIGYILVTSIGGIMVIAGNLQVGDIQSFIQYLRQFSQPITQTANIANVLQAAVAAAERIFELLDEPEEVLETQTPVSVENLKGNVKFTDVHFGYSEDKILINDLDLQVSNGDKIAIVGPTGAGKTTLVNLLLRFYDISGGTITIDDVSIMDMKRDDLRSMFGMVLQDTWLFKGTIRDNIRYGKLDSTDDEVKAAAKAAHAHQFIRQLPGGYDFVLNEDASNISQGQRQLLTIARAILSNPIILILDEATSSVDTRTEVLIQKAMNNLMANRTSFVIAHRLSTIKDADTILVMKDGDIIEKGNHTTLLAQHGFYCDLYNSQFSENNQA